MARLKRTLKISVLYTCRALGLFALSRRLSGGQLQILCYHGFEIDDESRFRPRMFMSDGVFRRRLRILERRGFSVLPLGEALERLYARTLPRSAVSITIDDGFHSVFKIALPALESFRYPATLYVTTYYVEKGTPIFRLVVQYLFWKSELDEVDLSELSWLGMSTVKLGSDEERLRAVRLFMRHGEECCTEPERQDLLDELARRLQVDIRRVRESRAFSLIDQEEMAALERSGVDIQLHTHRHTFPSDDPLRARQEVLENREILMAMTGHAVDHFCYPSGEWSPRQGPWLEAIGIKSATTCDIGQNDASTSPLELRRYVDGEDIADIEFEAEVSGFGAWLRRLKRRQRR